MLPLEPHGRIAIGPSRVYMAYGARWSIDQYAFDGAALGTIHATIQRRPVTEDVRERWQDPFLSRVSLQERPAMNRYLESLPDPDSLPALDLMVVDELENLWVRQFTIPGDESSRWFVFFPEGEQIASLAMPVIVRPLQIGADFVVALLSPEDAGEYVVVRSLHR